MPSGPEVFRRMNITEMAQRLVANIDSTPGFIDRAKGFSSFMYILPMYHYGDEDAIAGANSVIQQKIDALKLRAFDGGGNPIDRMSAASQLYELESSFSSGGRNPNLTLHIFRSEINAGMTMIEREHQDVDDYLGISSGLFGLIPMVEGNEGLLAELMRYVDRIDNGLKNGLITDSSGFRDKFLESLLLRYVSMGDKVSAMQVYWKLHPEEKPSVQVDEGSLPNGLPVGSITIQGRLSDLMGKGDSAEKKQSEDLLRKGGIDFVNIALIGKTKKTFSVFSGVDDSKILDQVLSSDGLMPSIQGRAILAPATISRLLDYL